jgi:hypothetical protein
MTPRIPPLAAAVLVASLTAAQVPSHDDYSRLVDEYAR